MSSLIIWRHTKQVPFQFQEVPAGGGLRESADLKKRVERQIGLEMLYSRRSLAVQGRVDLNNCTLNIFSKIILLIFNVTLSFSCS